MLAITFEGSACKAAFSAGVVSRLCQAGLRFPVASGSSSGALSATAVAAGKTRELPETWRRVAGTPLVSWRRLVHNRSCFDLSTILRDAITALLAGVDLQSSPGEAIVAATMLPDLATRYFSSREERRFVEILLGSCFIPGLYGRWVSLPVLGRNRFLFDGGIANNLPIEPLPQRGVKEIIAVVSRSRPFANKTPIQRKWLPTVVGAKVHLIWPPTPLAIRSWDLNRESVEQAISVGTLAAEQFLRSYRPPSSLLG